MEKTLNKEKLKTRMCEAVTEILNEDNDKDTLTKNLIEINRVLTDISEIRGEESDQAKNDYIILSSGIAISPEFAAMNLRDVLRTVKYLRGVKKAIDFSIKRLKEKKVHIMYAGSGPYGTLVLPLLSLYNPENLKLTLLEIQPRSLESVKNICNTLELGDFINGIIQTDASKYTHPADDPIHIVVMECMLHALEREPQVSISRNLCAQMDTEGILIPEQVNVSLYAIDPDIEFKMNENNEKQRQKARHFLGDIFSLDKTCYNLPVYEADDKEYSYIQAANLTLPENLHPTNPLMFFTTLKIFDDVQLDFYESGITNPIVCGHNDSLKAGDKLSFRYRLNSYPGFYYEKETHDPWA